MKTYLLKQLNKLLTIGEKLDELSEVKSIICDKAWHVFNDADISETYLFKEDGTLKIIYGGSVSDATWKYEPVLKCIEVKANNNQNYMLQVAFFDQKLLTLRLYQSDDYCFLIEQEKLEQCGFKTLNDITEHLKAIEEKKQQQLLLKQAEEEKVRKQEQERLEQERKRQQKLEIDFARYKHLVDIILGKYNIAKIQRRLTLISAAGWIGWLILSICLLSLSDYHVMVGIVGSIMIFVMVIYYFVSAARHKLISVHIFESKLNQIVEFVKNEENITTDEEITLRKLIHTINWSDKTKIDEEIKYYLNKAIEPATNAGKHDNDETQSAPEP